jgi:hypothetical protein
VRTRRALWVAACLGLFLWRGGEGALADGATPDESFHLAYGERALRHGTFLRDSGALNSKMPVSVLNAAAVAAAERVRGELSPAARLFAARVPSLLLGTLLGWLVFRWAGELFGWAAGALALFLYSFCPNVLAHAHLVTTDIATALAMFAATYAFWRYLEQPARGRLVIAAAAFGAAQLTKATALFLLPIFALLLALRAGRARHAADGSSRSRRAGVVQALGRGAAILALLGCGALLVLNLGFLGEGSFTPLARYRLVSRSFQALAAVPVLRDVPLPLPYGYVQGLDMQRRDSAGPAWSYLHGRYSTSGFWSYFLVALALKVPLSTQILLAAALWLCLSGRARAPGAEAFLVVPVMVLLAYFSLDFPLQIGLRYILPIFPFLFVFVSRIARTAPVREESGLEKAGPGPWRQSAAWVAAVVALLAWNASASWRFHPHYLAYFNELVGGPAGGYRWLVDSNLDGEQDSAYVREVYAVRSAVPVIVEPPAPMPGRIAVSASDLIGRDPFQAARFAWLRDHFRPVAFIRHSWLLYDVTEDALAGCCAVRWTSFLPELGADLALRGEPIGGADGGVRVRLLERLNDGGIGAKGAKGAKGGRGAKGGNGASGADEARGADAADDDAAAARTLPPSAAPVRAWFGIRWREPQVVGRVVAFPGFYSRGPRVRSFLALDYVLQFQRGERWVDIAGTRVVDNRKLRVEHAFPPIRTTAVRILIERERDGRGEIDHGGTYRAACLEFAAFPR